MPHPDDGQLLAWIDGELEPADESGVTRHVESCARCSGRAEAMRLESQAFSHAVLALDVEAPGLSDPGPIPVAAALSHPGSHRLRRTGWSLARAAGLVLVAAGAAAALVPGSPFRDWIESTFVTAPATPTGSVESAVPEDATGELETAGPTAISVELPRGELTVNLRGFGHSSNVHVRLSGERRASVRVEGAAVSPRFVTGPGTLEVIGSGEGEIWVELPRSASEGAVLVDGEPAVRLEGGRMVILWPEADSPRGEAVFRIGD
jgi:hypothetical protein